MGHDAGAELHLWVDPNRRKVKRPDSQRPEPPPMKTTLEHPPASGSEKGAETKRGKSAKVTLLQINDTHGYLDLHQE